MASVHRAERSSTALCSTLLSTWTNTSQQSSRTILAKAWEKGGGTGGLRAGRKGEKLEFSVLHLETSANREPVLASKLSGGDQKFPVATVLPDTSPKSEHESCW